jgi:hypothetical protein
MRGQKPQGAQEAHQFWPHALVAQILWNRNSGIESGPIRQTGIPESNPEFRSGKPELRNSIRNLDVADKARLKPKDGILIAGTSEMCSFPAGRRGFDPRLPLCHINNLRILFTALPQNISAPERDRSGPYIHDLILMMSYLPKSSDEASVRLWGLPPLPPVNASGVSASLEALPKTGVGHVVLSMARGRTFRTPRTEDVG